jgi:hypothetical protein
MSTTVTTSGTYTDGSQETNTGLPGNVTPIAINQTFRHNLQDGSAADQVHKIYAATLAFTGSPIVLNLFDNSSGTQVTDLYGTPFAFSAVRKVYIKHKGTTDAQPLKLGYSGTTANAWTAILSNPGQIFLQPSSANNDGGILLVAPNTTGWAVATGSKLLQLDPGANTFNADIVIVGV